MRLKLDENLPAALADLLRSTNHDVATIYDEDLAGAKDPLVAAAVNQEDRIFMTFDLDFGDIRKYPLGSHSGIVVFRLNDQKMTRSRSARATIAGVRAVGTTAWRSRRRG